MVSVACCAQYASEIGKVTSCSWSCEAISIVVLLLEMLVGTEFTKECEEHVE